MMIHLLDQQNLLRLDDPVCEYVPEFARRRQALDHDPARPDPSRRHPEPAARGAAPRAISTTPTRWSTSSPRQRPTGRAGRQLAYHAVTGGFVLGEVVRRVTGKTIRTVLDETVRRPARLPLARLRRAIATTCRRSSTNYVTGPPPLPPFSHALPARARGELPGGRRASRTIRAFSPASCPAGNVVATANEMSRFFQLLLDGGVLDGVRVFEPAHRAARDRRALVPRAGPDARPALPLRHGLHARRRLVQPVRARTPSTPTATSGSRTSSAGPIPSDGWPRRSSPAASRFLYPELYYLFDAAAADRSRLPADRADAATGGRRGAARRRLPPAWRPLYALA